MNSDKHVAPSDELARAWDVLPWSLRCHPGIKALYRAALAQQPSALPTAWRILIGASDVWGYCESESDADFMGRQSGLRYVKEPLYATPQATPTPAPSKEPK